MSPPPRPCACTPRCGRSGDPLNWPGAGAAGSTRRSGAPPPSRPSTFQPGWTPGAARVIRIKRTRTVIEIGATKVVYLICFPPMTSTQPSRDLAPCSLKSPKQYMNRHVVYSWTTYQHNAVLEHLLLFATAGDSDLSDYLLRYVYIYMRNSRRPRRKTVVSSVHETIAVSSGQTESLSSLGSNRTCNNCWYNNCMDHANCILFRHCVFYASSS